MPTSSETMAFTSMDNVDSTLSALKLVVLSTATYSNDPTFDSHIQLFNSFVISRIEGNNLLAGLPACQMLCIHCILNYAVRVTYNMGKYNQVTSFLMHKLHWLRVPQRVKYKSMQDSEPLTYIQQFCINVIEVQRRRTFRSAIQNNLILPRSKSKLEYRSFSVNGYSTWNSLLGDIKTSLSNFLNRLKTDLFRELYSCWHC